MGLSGHGAPRVAWMAGRMAGYPPLLKSTGSTPLKIVVRAARPDSPTTR